MHNEDSETCEVSYHALESASPESDRDLKKNKGNKKTSKKSLLKNWPLMSSIIVYCVFSLHDMAYTEVWIYSPFLFTNFYIHGQIGCNCSSFCRYFHCGQSVPGSMEVLVIQPKMLV